MPEFTIGPLPDAVRRIAGKTPVASRLRTEEWALVPLALRERAQFSAGVESVRLIGTMQEKLAKSIGMVQERVAGGEAWVDRSSFIGDLRKIAQEEGLATGDGSITDVSSRARLGLIYDTQTRQASEFARWKVGQDADVLDAYPAQELVREESREVPRDWRARWTAAGGIFTGGRMVALKSDPIWAAISRFGTPWPPFDFGSGMGVEDVSREEAEAMGLLPKGAPVKPQGERDFNENLEASVKDVPPEMRDWMEKEFKGQVTIDGDRARWTAQEPPTVQGQVEKALAKRVEARAPKPPKVSAPPPPFAPGQIVTPMQARQRRASAVSEAAAHGFSKEVQGQIARTPPAVFRRVDPPHTEHADTATAPTGRYIPATQTIQMSNNPAEWSGRPSLWHHENGHHIDARLGLSGSYALTKALESDYSRWQKSAAKRYGSDWRERFKFGSFDTTAINEHMVAAGIPGQKHQWTIEGQSRTLAFFDSIASVSDGKYGWGHPPGTPWQGEAVANVYQAQSMGWKEFAKAFPKTWRLVKMGTGL